jgi:hypothetical protein
MMLYCFVLLCLGHGNKREVVFECVLLMFISTSEKPFNVFPLYFLQMAMEAHEKVVVPHQNLITIKRYIKQIFVLNLYFKPNLD